MSIKPSTSTPRPRTLRRRARAAGLGLVSAAALAGTALTAAPAAAAPTTSLTAASCQAQGGTFARAQGVKTCTIGSPNVVVSDPQTYSKTVTAPYTVSADVISQAQLYADGYEGIWTIASFVSTTTVLTQKGGGAVASTTTSAVVGQAIDGYDCYSLVRLNDGTYYRTGSATYGQCDALGIYPGLPFYRG